ncbi:MAG: CPBP family intramembrane metalloprotease [Anaerolineaceae bacterium]|nr:CPBP family intramembrane metalloprotease [Anaerolineaceae bacterium]
MTSVDKNRVYMFLGITFGLAWITALVIAITGGLENSIIISKESGASLASILLPTIFMGSPMIANMLTRIITREGMLKSRLKINFKVGWQSWIFAWFGPLVLTVIGVAVFFLIFPGLFDRGFTGIQTMIDQAAAKGTDVTDMTPMNLIVSQLFQVALMSPLIYSIFSFGEEFGWRGYLLDKLMPLGWKKATLATGVIWGIWYIPLVLMGYNYGYEYFGAPVLGIVPMVWYCMAASVLLGWVTLQGRSVWPAVIGRSAVNGIAALGLLFMIGTPNLLLGPFPFGLIASIGFVLAAAAVLYFWKGPKPEVEQEEPKITIPAKPVAVKKDSDRPEANKAAPKKPKKIAKLE